MARTDLPAAYSFRYAFPADIVRRYLGSASLSFFFSNDFSAISLGILIAFRYMVQWVVYIVLIGAILACIGGSAYLW